MSKLFEIEPCLSPRLKWLEKHEVKTVLMPEDSENWFPDEPWVAYTGEFKLEEGWDVDKMTTPFGTGATEEDAITDWAKANNLRLWNEMEVKL